MMLAVVPEDVDSLALSQCSGELVPGLSAIEGVNPGVYRWRQLGTRSLNGVIGDASVANALKGEALLEAAAAKLAEAILTPALWNAPI
jgi:creatinine amidohydrolase/Fe(II)-dependent formamide hydrolase-like protein